MAPRFWLVYNGELYNDHELRVELERVGHRFASSCDTETLLRLLARDWEKALPRLRGMYAFACYDRVRNRLLLARDPFGMKPLYYAFAQGGGAGREFVFASEPTAILEHPQVSRAPDPAMVSAYLTTIRTTLADRTMYRDIRCVRPGEVLEVDLSGELRVGSTACCVLSTEWAPGGASSALNSQYAALDHTQRSALVTDALRDSVRAHLRADRPVCSLLSGGLDSSIIALLARQFTASAAPASSSSLSTLHSALCATYCSGAPDGRDRSADFEFARLVATALGAAHTEAPVSREMFRQRWPEMIASLGVPLSTPNEVAINEVARRLRADGHIVALSGEGADELFGGYAPPMLDAWTFERGRAESPWEDPASRGHLQLASGAWTPLQIKPTLFKLGFWRAAEQDHFVKAFYAETFAKVCEECGDGHRQDASATGATGDRHRRDACATGCLEPHLRFHRRVNLAGLLQRLDTATMLEGVEGRTPFADRAVAAIAEALPMTEKFAPPPDSTSECALDARVAGARTKIALRDAFARELPESVVLRPKASFPLPFETWVADMGRALLASSFVREHFDEGAVALIAAEPHKHWRFAWPMINIALWAR